MLLYRVCCETKHPLVLDRLLFYQRNTFGVLVHHYSVHLGEFVFIQLSCVEDLNRKITVSD